MSPSAYLASSGSLEEALRRITWGPRCGGFPAVDSPELRVGSAPSVDVPADAVYHTKRASGVGETFKRTSGAQVSLLVQTQS